MLTTISTNNLVGGEALSLSTFSGCYVENALRSIGISALYCDSITSFSATLYNFKIARARDILKLDKSIKVLSVILHCKVSLDTSNLDYDFSLMIFHKSQPILDFKNCLQNSNDFVISGHQVACVGIDIYNEQTLLDFKKISHVLIAGTTGSGKSVMLNSLICSLFYSTPILDMDFYFIDCKKVELNAYSVLPNCKKFITSAEETIDVLESLCNIMDERYTKMERQNIKQYNGKHIYIVIDELADLMLLTKYEIEPYLVRLAQKSRACNMHLILATQRPTVNVITGLIKANIPCRIALKVASVRDSINILDHKGAESLNSNGDAIIKYPYTTTEYRFQGAFCKDIDIQITINQIIGG